MFKHNTENIILNFRNFIRNSEILLCISRMLLNIKMKLCNILIIFEYVILLFLTFYIAISLELISYKLAVKNDFRKCSNIYERVVLFILRYENIPFQKYT